MDATWALVTNSFLSPAVKDLLTTAVSACRSSSKDYISQQAVIHNSDGSISFDFDKLKKCIEEGSSDGINPELQKSSIDLEDEGPAYPCFGYFKRLHTTIGPTIQEVYDCAENIPVGPLSTHLMWTGRANDLAEAFDLCRSPLPDKISVLLALQTTTCAVERALGDVIVSAGAGSVPFLLKDILSHPVLQEVFGTVPMTLLTAVMGPPHSLNLRNLAWHGFLSPDEIIPQWVVFVVIVLSSISTIADHYFSSPKKLQHRPSLYLHPDLYPRSFQLLINGLDMRSPSEDLGRALQAEVIPSQTVAVWTRIMGDMSNGKSWSALQLALPQFETVLRIIFARVNKQEFRLLTAEQDEFFTTFDEILAAKVGNEENRIRSVLGDEHLILLLDLLIYPKGPRIRHRISHGEIDEKGCPDYLIKAVFIAIIGVLERVSSPDHASSLAQEIIEHYEPQFHPVDELWRKYHSFLNSLRALEICPTIPDYSRSRKMDEVFRDVSCTLEESESASGFSTLEKRLRNCPFTSLYRPAEEFPVIKLIDSIMNTAQLSSFNVEAFLRVRHATYTKDGCLPRQLESNYLSFMRLLPCLIQAWLETFLATLRLFNRVQRDPGRQDKSSCLAWLRKTLQVWQNVAELSGGSRNDWPKISSWIAKLSSPPILTSTGTSSLLHE